MSLLYNLDFLSKSIPINVQGQATHRTGLSTLLSILVGLSCIGLSLYFFIETISRTHVSVVYTDEFNGKEAFYNFSDYPIVYSLTNAQGVAIPEEERIIDIQAKIWIRDEQLNWDSRLLKLEKCKFEWYPRFEEELKKKLLGDEFYCVNPADPQNKDVYFTKGTFAGNDFAHQMSFHMFRCVNSTIRNNCFPKEIIDKELSYFYFTLNYISAFIDGTSEIPGREYLESYTWLTSINLFKLFNIYYREINYFSDIGFVFEEKQLQKFYTVEPVYIETSIGMRGEEFSTVRIGNSPIKSKYNRKYAKFQDMIAQIGGVIKAILILGSLLYEFMARKLFIKEISGAIFHFQSNKTKYNTSRVFTKKEFLQPTKYALVTLSNNNMNLDSSSVEM